MLRKILSVIFPLQLVRFVWGLKQIPCKKYRNLPILSDFLTNHYFKVIDEQTTKLLFLNIEKVKHLFACQ